jgi:hypothetical protein
MLLRRSKIAGNLREGGTLSALPLRMLRFRIAEAMGRVAVAPGRLRRRNGADDELAPTSATTTVIPAKAGIQSRFHGLCA